MVEPDEIWRHTDAQRRDLADLLAGLSPDQWEQASVCPGWRVRDVAAHLTLAPATTVGSAALEFVRARGSFHRMIFDTAVRAAARPTVVSADRVWQLGFPFHARRRLRGYQLRALDADWTRGDGPVIEGPIDALLLLLTGRDRGPRPPHRRRHGPVRRRAPVMN